MRSAIGALLVAVPLVQDTAPSPRSDAALVVLPNGSIAVYGGYAPQGRPPDAVATVWLHDGRGWTARPAPSTAPSPGVRSDMAAMRDHRGRMIVVGGTEDDSARGDVWAWSSAGWQRVGGDAPGARHLAAGAYDEVRRQVVLHGGHDLVRDVMPSTTWAFDGERWMSTDASPGPGSRFAAGMVWDPVRRQVLLHGGDSPDGVQHRDTWAWDGTRWRLLATGGPALGALRALVPDPQGRGILLIASPGDRVLGELETWLLEGGAWRLLVRGGPSPRSGHALASDPARRRVVLFGGQASSNTKFNDLWSFDGHRWTRR